MTHNARVLPDDFRWVPRYQLAERELAIEHGGKQVAMLLERVDGSWYARLNTHRPWTDGVQEQTRACSGYDAGRAGIEQWITRHAERLRAEVAALPARQAMPWLPKQARADEPG